MTGIPEKNVRTFMAEIDSNELAVRLIAEISGHTPPPGMSAQEALDELYQVDPEVPELAVQLAHAALKFMAEQFAKAQRVS